MGILRTDRVSGLGGANAITGSTSFNGGATSGNHLLVNGVDTEFGTSGSFTMEFWMNPIGTQIFYSGTGNIGLTAITDPRTSDSSVHPLVWISGGHGSKTKDVLYYYAGGSDRIVGTTVLQKNRWYHVAVVRTGGTTTMYLDGSSEGSFSDSLDYAANNGFFIGQRYTSTQYNFNGHISNFRLIKGTALYTGTFTPPTTRLTKASGTEILCCNSSSDVTNDETGKIINVGRSSTNDTGPVASRFTPNSPVGFSTTTDVGTQFGSTFDGVTTFDSQAYMVPPSGNTRERNRGTALFGGASTTDDVIQKILIQSTGNAEDFGDLSGNRYENESAASSTRGVFAGGYTEDTSPNQKVNIIEFVTIAVSSNTTDFGDLTSNRGHSSGASNATRGVIAGGTAGAAPHPVTNVIDFFTIATTGNASDFGDTTSARKFMGGGRSSTTRALFCGGNDPTTNAIDFVTIATTGNAQDFGDCTQTGWAKGAGNVSSGTRAILAGGFVSPTNINVIEFLTIATLGNGTDFGDLAVATRAPYAAGSKVRGIFGGGKTNPASATTNTISFITIATTGNASDFGDMINSKAFGSGLSDCHGGLE